MTTEMKTCSQKATNGLNGWALDEATVSELINPIYLSPSFGGLEELKKLHKSGQNEVETTSARQRHLWTDSSRTFYKLQSNETISPFYNGFHCSITSPLWLSDSELAGLIEFF